MRSLIAHFSQPYCYVGRRNPRKSPAAREGGCNTPSERARPRTRRGGDEGLPRPFSGVSDCTSFIAWKWGTRLDRASSAEGPCRGGGTSARKASREFAY